MDNELYHHGVKGQKWGVIRERRKSNAYDRYLAKQKKRENMTNGSRAYIKYMDDAERKRYAKGRVKNMGSKAQAIRSETTNYIGKTAKTLLKGTGATAGGMLGGALAATAGMSVSNGAAFTAALLGGATIGGVAFGAVAVGTLTAATIARGARYVKNVNAIKNVKHK